MISNNLSGGVESRHAEAPDKSGDPSTKNDLRSSALVRSNNVSGSSVPPAQSLSQTQCLGLLRLALPDEALSPQERKACDAFWRLQMVEAAFVLVRGPLPNVARPVMVIGGAGPISGTRTRPAAKFSREGAVRL